MSNLIHIDKEYKEWISSIKEHIRSLQIKMAVSVNSSLIHLYWELGASITEKQNDAQWGDGLIVNMSEDLSRDFPDMKGFSVRNLQNICRWYRFYNNDDANTKQLVSQMSEVFFNIPWGHHVLITTKCDTVSKALFYIAKTAENNWSRAVLHNFLGTDLYERQGKAITNFKQTLPEIDSDLAQQTLKDPYCFDFLTMRERYNERELEDALTNNITKFLIELGKGFAYVGRQVPIEVDDSTYYIDLLFYHLELRCFVVVELKAIPFDPSYLGQLNFYVNAINHTMRKDADAKTIGLLVCKSKNNTVAQYALEGIDQPIGISSYELTKLIPENFKSSLPSIEEIENELNDMIV